MNSSQRVLLVLAVALVGLAACGSASRGSGGTPTVATPTTVPCTGTLVDPDFCDTPVTAAPTTTITAPPMGSAAEVTQDCGPGGGLVGTEYCTTLLVNGCSAGGDLVGTAACAIGFDPTDYDPTAAYGTSDGGTVPPVPPCVAAPGMAGCKPGQLFPNVG